MPAKQVGDRAGDNWTPSEVNVNFLELLAVFHSLKAFNDKLEGQHVKIMCDNTTAVCCKNHMGTSHSECCNALTVEIWEWCVEHDIWLTAAHIPGAANVQGDYESRVVHTGKEWQLNKEMLQCTLVALDRVSTHF